MNMRILAIGLMLTGLLAGQAMEAEARDRVRQTSIQGSGGHGATRDLAVANDRAAGTHSRSGRLVANDGRTISRDASASRTETGGQSAATLTGPKGGSSNRSASTTCIEGVSCTRDAQRMVTSPTGEQWSRTRSSTVTGPTSP